MKTIKLIEVVGYGCFSLVMWWAAISTLMGKSFVTVKQTYGGAMTFFGVIAFLLALLLSYATYKNWREYRAGNFD